MKLAWKRLGLLVGAPLALLGALACSRSGSSSGQAANTPASPAFTVRVAAAGLAQPAGLAAAGGGTLVVGQSPANPADATLAELDLASGRVTVLGAGPAVQSGFAADPAGTVYWMDGARGALMSRDLLGGAPAVVHSGGALPATVVATDAEGGVYVAGAIANAGAGEVAALFRNGAATTIPDAGGPAKTALAAATSGDLYWTSRDAGQIYHRAPDGRGSVVLAGLDHPQAIALAPAEDILYFTEMPTPGTAGSAGGRNTVNALDLATGRRTVIDRGDPDPAGLAAAEDGNLYWTSTSRGAVMVAVPAAAPSAGPQYSAALTGAAEVPPVDTQASGQATFRLRTGAGTGDDDDRLSRGPSLSYRISLSGLSRIRRIEIRQGAAGATGPVVAILSRGHRDRDDGHEAGRHGRGAAGRLRPRSLKGPLAGDWAGFVAALDAGGLYLNVTTEAHPDGELRGQILAPGTPANRPPAGVITAPAGDMTVQAGQPVSFAGTASDPDGDAVTVLWTFGDGTTSADLAPGPHTFAMAGTFTVTFTATDALGLSDPNPPSRTITVQPAAGNQAPTGTITAPAGNVTIAAGQSVTFAGTASDPDGDPVTVAWDFGDGGGSALLAPGAHAYATAGTYTVRFTATDSHGLADPNPPTRTITVQPVAGNQAPTGAITAPAGNVTIAAGQSVTFAGTASDPDGDPVTVAWDFGDGGSSTQLSPGAHTYAAAGTYTVRFTATDSHGLADPNPPTRTVTVTAAAPTLTQVQAAIFTPSCTGCHGSGGSAGLDLRAGNAWANLVNVPATTLPGLRVVPGNSTASALVVQLANGHRNVSAANQAMISAWIDAGALNN